MQDERESFSDTAVKLSRGPLGIIALFIVLVDFFAAAVLGPFGSSLDVSQRWVLLVFIVLFPMIVFGVFSWLLVRHHTKLYGPADFRSDEAFITTLTAEEQRIRLLKEVEDSAPSVEEGSEVAEKEHKPPLISITQHGRREATYERDSTDPVAQYVVAEDLAIRHFESQYGVSFRRHVRLEIGAFSAQLDGIATKGDQFLAVEVLLSRRLVSLGRVREVLYKARSVAERLSSQQSFVLLLAIVYRDEVRPVDVRRIGEEIKFAGFPVHLHTLSLEELKKSFGFHVAGEAAPIREKSAPNPGHQADG